jgi:hypothetical protein
MCLVKRHFAYASTILLLIVLIVPALAGCSTDKKSSIPTPNLPDDPKPVTVVKGQAVTLDLAGGGYLIIPPGTIDPGTTVQATYKGIPNGKWPNIAPTFAPVELITNPKNAIHGILQLEFPVPTEKIIAGVDPAMQFGISTYDDKTQLWTPVKTTYDTERHMVIALIQHFSWWNPFTWDWGALARAVQQGFGQLWGERAAPPQCSGQVPSWVSTINFLTVQNDAQIRACAQTSAQWPGVLEVRMVNNRPYGQILTYGSGVQWGWHDTGSVEDRARNAFMDLFMGPNQLYLPPLSSATVGILKPNPGADVTFTIWPTWQTVGADIAFYALGQVQHLPIEKGFDSVIKAGVGACSEIGPEKALTDVSISAIHDDIGQIANCIEEAFSFDVAAGIMNDVEVGRLESWYGTIKTAKVLGTGLQVADVIWKVGDLVSDAILRDMPRGNGFEIQAVNGSSGSNQPPTPTPPTPTPPTPAPPTSAPPTPVPAPKTYPEQVWSSTGVNTFTNYHNASGIGPKLAHNQWIDVSCKVYDPTIPSVNPDGYWYRIASSPWNNAYYSPANTFYNGDPPTGPFTHPTDWNVPNC